MARKSINFNVSEDTFNQIKAIFPDAVGTDDNLRQLIQAYLYHEQHKDDAPAEQQLAALREQLAQSETCIANLEQQLQAATTQADDLRQQLATAQDQTATQAETIAHLEEANNHLQHREATWEQIRATLKPFPVALLEQTAQHLSERYKRDIDPMSILVDMFLRYTIERNAEWFYPFVLRDADILATAHQLNENITTIAQVRKIILRP